MKLALPWRRPRPAEPEQSKPHKGDGPPINIRVPREAVYKSFTGQPGPCPRCGGELRQSYQTYLIATRRGGQAADSLMTGNKDMGWFCVQCPTVVINSDEVGKLLRYQLSHWDLGDRFAVLGVIDMDAVPKDKRSAPLGEDGNPIPLIEFTHISGAKPGKRRKPKSKARRR